MEHFSEDTHVRMDGKRPVTNKKMIEARPEAQPDARQENRPEVCVICGKKAFGYNYEVISCNACKMFFRRVTQREVLKACKFDGKCFEGPNLAKTLPQCRPCRYKKCIKVGMRCNQLPNQLPPRPRSPESSEIQPTSPQTPVSTAMVPHHLVTQSHIHSNLLQNLSRLHNIRMEVFGVINVKGEVNFVDLVAQEPKLGEYMKPQPIDWSGRIKPWVTLGTILISEICKTMDFYKELLLSDRVVLLKAVAFKSHFLSVSYDSYMRKKGKMMAPNDIEMIPPVLDHIPGLKKFVQDLLSTPVEPMIELKLTENEYLLLNMIVICDPEILGLSPGGKAILGEQQRLHAKLLLDSCLISNAREGAARFASILAITQRLEKMVYLTQKLVFYLRTHFNPNYAPCQLTYDSCRMEKCKWLNKEENE